MLSKEKTLIIDNFRVPLSIAVFLSHAGSGMDMDKFQVIRYEDCGNQIVGLFFDLLNGMMPIMVIPGFFLISGYLFFLKWEEREGVKVWSWICYGKKLHSRLFSLLIPYILWNIIPLFVELVFCVIKCYDRNLTHEMYHVLQGKFPRMFWAFHEWGGGAQDLLICHYIMCEI